MSFCRGSIKMCLSLVLFLFLSNDAISKEADSAAVNDHNLQYLLRNWVATPLMKNDYNGGHYESKLFQRFVRTKTGLIQIGSITYYLYPNKESNFSEIDTADKIAKAMQLKNGWHVRKNGKSVVFESELPNRNRFVRLYMTKMGDSVAISTAMIHKHYAEDVALEAEIIQRYTAKEINEKYNTLEKLISMILLPEAIAAETGPLSPFGGGPTSSVISGSGNPLTGIMGGLMNTNGSGLPTGKLTGSVGQSSGMFGIPVNVGMGFDVATRDQLQSTTSMGSDFNNTIKTGIVPNWSTTNSELNEANKNLNQSNGLMKEFMDPKHAFVWAAASAAGAVTGAMAVNLAVDGIVAGGRWLWEAITNEKEEAVLLQRMREAMQKWEENEAKMKALEDQIAQSLAARDQSVKYGLSNTTALELAALIDVQDIKRDDAKEKLKLAIRNKEKDECIRNLSMESARLNGQLQILKKISSTIGDSENVKGFMDEKMCHDLRETMDKVKIYEEMKQDLRGRILAAQDLWLKQKQKDFEETQKNYRRAREKRAAVTKNTKKIAKTVEEIEKDDLDESKEIWMKNCISRRRTTAIEKSWLYVFVPQGGNCEKEFNEKLGSYQEVKRNVAEARRQSREKEADDMLAFANKTSTGLMVSGKTLDESVDAYSNWFKKLSIEQACSNEHPEACPEEFKNNDKYKDIVARNEKRKANVKKIDELCSGKGEAAAIEMTQRRLQSKRK